MQWQFIIGIIPGLLIFIYGIGHLSHEIQNVAGRRFKKLLSSMTKSSIRGVVLGAGATSLLQSSSATMLIMVSLVNTGALTLEQSLGVIFGSSIGTAITSQLVAFKLTVYAPIFLVLGFLIGIFGRQYKFLGKAVFYFGLVFFALHIVGQAVDPIKTDPSFQAMFSSLTNPFIGILAGFLFTALVQSSSVTSGITVLLGAQGLLDVGMAVPIILGANIGTTTLALLSVVGMEPSARRCAYAHTLFNLGGVLLVLPLLPLFLKLLAFLGGGVGQQIANGHVILNIVLAVLFLILLAPFARLVRWLVPSDVEEITRGPLHLDVSRIPSTRDAIRLIEKELSHQTRLVNKLFKTAVDAVRSSDHRKAVRTAFMETAIIDLNSDVIEYILVVARRRLTRAPAKRLDILMNIANTLENLGATGNRIAKDAIKLYEHGIVLQKGESQRLQELFLRLDASLSEIEVVFLEAKKPNLRLLCEIRREADAIIERIHAKYLQEFRKQHLDPYSGPLFADASSNLEHANHVVERIGRMLAGKNHVRQR